MDTEKRTATQVESEGLEDWRVLLRTLQASFRTGSMAKGLDFAARIGVAADAANHHPDLTITYPRVHVLLTTHDAGGLTARDVDLARTISGIAVELGVEAEPGAVTQLEVAIDALDIPAVKPFWEAVLGFETDGDIDLLDPYGRAPAFWFQQMDAPRPQRNRIHIDVTVPTTSPSSASPPRWRPAAPSSPTRPPPPSGSSPTPRATRPASPPGKAATRPHRSRC